MTITNYSSPSSDVVFFKKGEHLKFNNEYCIFGIDFSKVISYKIKETTWKNNDPVNCKVFNAEPAIALFIILEGGKEYILMRKTSNPEKILNKDQIVDLKYIFDLLIYD